MISKSNNISYHDETSAFFQCFFPKKALTLIPLSIFNECDSLFRFDVIGKNEGNVFPNFFVISYKFYIKLFKVRLF